MKPWELIDSAPVPGSDSVMRLMRRGDELVIRVDDRELMSTRIHGSEDALADLACDHLESHLGGKPAARILIGGLGIGFTLAAALRRLGPKAEIVVAELVPAIIHWNRSILGEAAGYPVEDPRTVIHQGDVAELMRNPSSPWDAILLDVDNGPASLTRSSNDWLYGWHGLTAAYEALRPGGILGVWSAKPDDAFTNRVERAGFSGKPIQVRARGKKGGWRHTIWICTK